MKMISGHAALSLCLVLSAAICGVQATSTPDSLYYTAGVVEFRPTITDTSINILNEHLESYMDIVGSDEASETDIIVFPEGTLNNVFTMTYVPAASENVKPCDDTKQIYEDFLVTLSCVARTKRKYLVINLTEKENCTQNANIDPRPCASNGLNIYNTNVVFDREGRVISRYRKTHLYNEAKNSTLEPEFGIFETDFGVTFGHFICFDMLFYTPAQEMVREKNITNFILTSMFYSELPFLTGVQLQQSWSMGNNVNLLAAGASYPESGITGTGIFAGLRGTLASVMATGKGLRKLYVAQVPKQPLAMQSTTQKEATQASNDLQRTLQAADIKLMQDPNMTDFENWQINTAGFRQAGQICKNGFCCSFNLTMERKEDANVPGQKLLYYKYRVGVFNGKRTYGNGATNDVRVCGLYTCTDNTQSSCGQLLDIDAATAAGFLVKSNFRFRSIELKASLVKNDYLLIMPSTLNDDLLPLNAHNIDWNVTESDINYAVQITSTSTLDNLLTFGIYAQYYEQKIKDDDDDGNSADKRATISVTALLMCTATLLLVGWRRDAH